MLRFLKREEEPLFGEDDELPPSSKKYMKVDLSALPTDPGKRPAMESYHVNQRDEIRKAYLLTGPCQPRNHPFKPRKIGDRLRTFNRAWFNDYKYWLEYSIEKEAAFCLCCYLFKSEINYTAGESYAFVKDGFKSWDKRKLVDIHNDGSQHNLAVQKCQNLMAQSQSVTYKKTGLLKKRSLEDASDDDDDDYVSIDEAVGTPTCTRNANKEKGQSSQSCSSRMEGLIEEQLSVMKKIEVLLKKQEEQFLVLAGVVGRQVEADKAATDKRANLNGELKKIPNLSLQARLRAASLIIGDLAKLDLFYSLSNEERKEWVKMLLSCLI